MMNCTNKIIKYRKKEHSVTAQKRFCVTDIVSVFIFAFLKIIVSANHYHLV